jgi:hypothetical protein
MLEHWYWFLPDCFETDIGEWFNFSSCNFRVNMNKKNVRYLQGIGFLQLTFTKKIEIKNLVI